MAIRFAMAQRAISVAAGAAVLWLGDASASFGAPLRIDWRTLVVVGLGCAAFIAVSLALTSVATALTARAPVEHKRPDRCGCGCAGN